MTAIFGCALIILVFFADVFPQYKRHQIEDAAKETPREKNLYEV